MVYHKWIVLALMTILPTLTACNGQNTPSSEVPTTTFQETEMPTSIADNDVPELTETFSVENTLVNAVLSVNYPSGWFAQGEAAQILLTSQDPETLASGDDALIINILPAENSALPDGNETTPETLLESAMEILTGDTSTIRTTTINEHPAASAIGDFDDNVALIYTIQFGTGEFVVVTAINSLEISNSDEELVEAIVATITYEPGEIPQTGE